MTKSELLKKISAILHTHNIQHWLDAGTLLCAYRDGNLDNEHDVDLGIWAKDYEKVISLNSILEKELNCKGLPFRERQQHILYDADKKPIADIHAWHNLTDKMVSILLENMPVYIPAKLLNFKTFAFQGNSYLIPKETEHYLKLFFGNDWKSPISNDEYIAWQHKQNYNSGNQKQLWQKILGEDFDFSYTYYNQPDYQRLLGNNVERAVISKNDDLPLREKRRYEWAKENIKGTDVLEFGCSSGFGLKILNEIKDLKYLGLDKDEKIIEFAKDNFEGTFEVADIYDYSFKKHDTILALEFIEHLKDGREWAQKLKQHCDCLLISVPYLEGRGTWGPHHQIHGLTPKDFPDFEVKFFHSDGVIADTPDKFDGTNLLFLKWERGKTYNQPTSMLKEGVTATILTKDRYDTTLPLAISSIINQTYPIKKLIIVDDGEKKDLREVPLYKNLFITMDRKGIKWEVLFGLGGIPKSHKMALDACDTEWIWRMDDDCVAEPDVLEKLMLYAIQGTGAVGGCILDPKMMKQNSLASNKIEDAYIDINEQWFNGFQRKNVDHLYSSFVYRKEAASHGYCQELSPAGFREETLFTYEMKRNGWTLVFNPFAITWHYKNDKGGNRSHQDKSMWDWDNKIFWNKLKDWGVVQNKNTKLVVLDCGLGDTLAFKYILPELQKKYKNIVIANCYPEVFKDENINSISIEEAKAMGNIDKFSVYKYLWDHTNERLTLADGFRRLYL